MEVGGRGLASATEWHRAVALSLPREVWHSVQQKEKSSFLSCAFCSVAQGVGTGSVRCRLPVGHLNYVHRPWRRGQASACLRAEGWKDSSSQTVPVLRKDLGKGIIP